MVVIHDDMSVEFERANKPLAFHLKVRSINKSQLRKCIMSSLRPISPTSPVSYPAEYLTSPSALAAPGPCSPHPRPEHHRLHRHHRRRHCQHRTAPLARPKRPRVLSSQNARGLYPSWFYFAGTAGKVESQACYAAGAAACQIHPPHQSQN